VTVTGAVPEVGLAEAVHTRGGGTLAVQSKAKPPWEATSKKV
jgi:hypothetical protein